MNLQGSLTHDVSNVEICVTDLRTRTIEYLFENAISGTHVVDMVVGTEHQRSFIRSVPTGVPLLPILTYPKQTMQYVLLGLIALVNTASGRRLLRSADRYERDANEALDRLEKSLNRYFGLSNRKSPPRGILGSFLRG